MRRSIFIEGIPGTGKSTLQTRLAQEVQGYRVYREGDPSPVELAWCGYLTREQWEGTLLRYPEFAGQIREQTRVEGERYLVAYTRILAEKRAFYEEMERYEIYNGRVDFQTFHDVIMKRYQAFSGEVSLFECSFLQNSIETMMLFYEMEEDDILAFYEEAYGILRQKGFGLVYLDTDEIRSGLLQIKKERSDEDGNEMWYPLMLNFLKTSPYGKSHGYEGLEDVAEHFERRRRLEMRILAEILKQDCLILRARSDLSDLTAACVRFADMSV